MLVVPQAWLLCRDGLSHCHRHLRGLPRRDAGLRQGAPAAAWRRGPRRRAAPLHPHRHQVPGDRAGGPGDTGGALCKVPRQGCAWDGEGARARVCAALVCRCEMLGEGTRQRARACKTLVGGQVRLVQGCVSPPPRCGGIRGHGVKACKGLHGPTRGFRVAQADSAGSGCGRGAAGEPHRALPGCRGRAGAEGPGSHA